MTAQPLVTIGLPVYNGEDLLPRAIESVLAQTHTNIRLLISDNCSTDGTADLCRKYAMSDPRVVYTVTERNLGAVGNFNRVAAAADSPYFKWISHDDWIAPEFVERCVEVAESDRRIITVAPLLEVVDLDGNVLETVSSYIGRTGWSTDRLSQYREMMAEIHYCETHTEGLIMVPYEYGLHRLELLRRTRLEMPFLSGDTVLAAELALWGQLATIDEPMHKFTISTSATSTSANIVNWNPTAIQNMLDPSKTSRWQVFVSLRRRHLEHPRAVLRSPLSITDKLRALGPATRPTRTLISVRIRSKLARLTAARRG